MSSYLVTGGCGFIGSHLVDRLISQGHKVFILDNLSTGNLKNLHNKAILVRGDLCDAPLITGIMRQCDGCFHLAAIASIQESLKHWVKTHQTNLVGTITLLDIARVINEQRHFGFVYASSAAVYGDNSTPPIKETDPLNPISPYGVDKESCELQAKLSGQLFHLPNIGLRFFNVYGERQNPKSIYSGVISIFLNQLKKRKSIQIFGDGEQVRDFIYVQDVVTYLCQAMHYVNTDSLVFNVCNGTGISINQLAKTLIEITKINIPVIHTAAKPGDIRMSIGDNALAKDKLKITASTSLTEGLRLMCEHMHFFNSLKQVS